MSEKYPTLNGSSEAAQDSVTVSAASDLPPAAPAKPSRKRGSGYPSYLTTVRPDRAALTRTDRALANTDLLSFRNGASTFALIRDYVAASPDLSNAVFSYLRLGIPDEYRAIGRNPDGTINQDATRLAQQMLSRFEYFPPVEGHSGGGSLRSVSESLAKELVMYGALAGELVLDQSLLPLRLQPISVSTIEYWPGKDVKTLRPYQKVGQELLDLGYSTICILHLDQDLLEPYSESMLQSAIKPTLFSEDLAQDLHKIIKKAIHPRVHAKIDEEKFRKFGLSQAAQTDETLAREELDAIISSLESKLSGLSIDDALVYFDTIGIDVKNDASSGLGDEYKTLQDIADSRMAAGAKTMPAVLGKGGSQNTASAEVMLFVKSVSGTVKSKLDEFYSRILTSGVRLFGVDAYVEFKYGNVELRPKGEMLAFRQTEQGMTLELLSLGFISDEEASIRLTGELPPAGFKPLSGTMFRSASAVVGSPYNGETNNGSATNDKLEPDTPTEGRGKNKAELKAV